MSNDLFWEFENNNRFSKSEYSFEEAEKLNRTLVNCSNCKNCIKCSDCKECIDCINCKKCVKCKKSSKCINCEECSFCFDCVNCSWCLDKKSLKDIHNPSWR